jgi:hypothetical protein
MVRAPWTTHRAVRQAASVTSALDLRRRQAGQNEPPLHWVRTNLLKLDATDSEAAGTTVRPRMMTAGPQ